MADPLDLSRFDFLQSVTATESTDRGLVLSLGEEQLRVDVLREDLVRLKLSRNGAFDEKPSHAVCMDDPAPPSFETSDGKNEVSLTTSALEVTITKSPFAIQIARTDGTVILDTVVTDGKSRAYGCINDEWVSLRNAEREDAVLGLGEKTGRTDRRGHEYEFWNTDILAPDIEGRFRHGHENPRLDPSSTSFDPYYISIPFYYMLDQDGRASGFFLDNPYRGMVDFRKRHETVIHFRGGEYTEYVFAGPSMKRILGAYTELTGRMQAPPAWALGHHQCRWHRYTQDETLALARRYREKGIPCDVLWLDIDYMDGYRVFTWDNELFPDPADMLKALQADGFRVITIIDPGVKWDPGYEVFDSGMKRDVFCRTEGGNVFAGYVWPGKTAFPDFAKEDTRAWWGELNAEHVQSGLAGIWNDMNEPSSWKVPIEQARFESGAAPHGKYRNQYAMLMAMGTVEGLKKTMPDKRTFVLSRAGSAGIQRYAANWMGDNFSRWDHLWLSIHMGCGLGISGQPFVGADVGGFAEKSNPELLARWYQYGALTPFFRNHTVKGVIDQYPWAFGEVTEEICTAAVKLRYRLMPYIYSTFMRASETGDPIQTPLVYEFQQDRLTREIDDQYLFGPALLVAPVFESRVTERNVYLPEGTWHAWHTGEILSGKRYVTADSPMEWIPLYARGGTVIPLWAEVPQTTMGYQPETIDLRVFIPEKDGETVSFLHEDDGLTFAFEDGAFLRTTFTLTRSGNRLTLKAKTDGNGYPEFRRKRFRILFHGRIGERVTHEGNPVILQHGGLVIENSGTGFELSADVQSQTNC